MKQEPKTNGPAGNAPAEPIIEFENLAPAQKREVVKKATDAIRHSAPYVEHAKAAAQKKAAFDDERRRLNAEPLTTGAFFLGVAVLVGVAEEILFRINSANRTGDEIEDEDLCPASLEASPTVCGLIEDHAMLNPGSAYWPAYDAESSAGRALRAEEARILNETATRLFGTVEQATP